MTKWLRKYNKILLVVAGVVLMVSFLVGPAINQFGPNPAKRTVAYIGPNKARAVRGIDLGLAQGELAAMREFCAPMSGGARGEILFNILAIEDEVHWFLLVEEAKRAGFVASQDDGAAWIGELAAQVAPVYARERFIQEVDQRSPGLGNLLRQNPQFIQQIDPQRYQALLQEEMSTTALSRLQQSRTQVAGSARMTLEQFDAALTKLRGVMRMIVASMAAPAYSDRRAAAFGHEVGDSASIDYVFVTGSRLAGSVGEPTAEQLAAHFEQYRETMPGTGEFGLGYLQPPRARLAWLEINRAAIAAAVAETEIPPERLLDRWSRNRVLYPGEFTAEVERLKADLRDQKVNEVIDLARRSVLQQVHRKTQGLERSGAYFVLGEGWVAPSLEEIALGVVAEVSGSAAVSIPLPSVTVLNGPWQNRLDLGALPGIGQSQIRQGATTVPFPDAVLAARELSGENPLAIQTRVPQVEQPLQDASGNLYFLMVLDVRATGAADSIDEVIEQVRRDYIAMKGYELLRMRIDSLAATAASEGLDAVAALFPPEQAAPEGGEPAVALVVERDRPVSARPADGFPLPLGSRGFCEAVMEAARRLDPTVPAPDQPIGLRTVAHPVPEGLGVGVARVVWFSPLTRERYRGFARGGLFNTVLEEWQEVLEPGAMTEVSMASYTGTDLRTRWQWVERDE